MQTCDVVVVGAGYAGLVAARDVAAAGADVVVLEARDRIGGRVHSTTSRLGSVVDLGGQWLGAAHDRFAALAAGAGTSTFPTPDQGDVLLDEGAHLRRGRTMLRSLGPGTAAQVAWTLARVDRAAARVDLGQPWRAPNAAELDGTTVATWLRRSLPGQRARRLVECVLGEALCADVGSVSLLWFLAGTKASGGLAHMLSTAGGAQQSLFPDGAAAPAWHLAATLGPRVRLSWPVAAIVDHGEHVTVSGPAGALRCRRTVVTVPLPLTSRIAFEPELPPARRRLADLSPMGSITKVVAVYERPFWRASGLSGELLSTAGPLPAVFDSSPPGGPGHLCALIASRRSRALAALAPAARRATVLRELVRCFGRQAGEPVEVLEKTWDDDPWSRGGYGAYLPPGVLTEVRDAARRPVGRVHWAGTETATEHPGYIEGAVRSGERAAREVLQLL